MGRPSKQKRWVYSQMGRSYWLKTRFEGKTARVLAKAGQNLGGSDIDNWLVDYFQLRDWWQLHWTT